MILTQTTLCSPAAQTGSRAGRWRLTWASSPRSRCSSVWTASPASWISRPRGTAGMMVMWVTGAWGRRAVTGLCPGRRGWAPPCRVYRWRTDTRSRARRGKSSWIWSWRNKPWRKKHMCNVSASTDLVQTTQTRPPSSLAIMVSTSLWPPWSLESSSILTMTCLMWTSSDLFSCSTERDAGPGGQRLVSNAGDLWQCHPVTKWQHVPSEWYSNPFKHMSSSASCLLDNISFVSKTTLAVKTSASSSMSVSSSSKLRFSLSSSSLSMCSSLSSSSS